MILLMVRENAKHRQKYRSQLARRAKVKIMICNLNVMNLRQANLMIMICNLHKGSDTSMLSKLLLNLNPTQQFQDRSLKCCPGWIGVKYHELLCQSLAECSQDIAMSTNLLIGFGIASAYMTTKSTDGL
jgi:hypothetical protein